jgi:PQQ-like domain
MVKVLRIGAALLAATLAASMSACGSSPGPATTGLTTRWTVRQTSGPGVSGTWFTDGMMVTGTIGGITALSLRTGHTEWSWNPPAPPSGDYTSVALSPSTADGVGLVTYEYLSQTQNTPVNRPGHEVGIDLTDGRAIWTRTIESSLNVEAPGYQLGDGLITEIDDNGNSKVAYVAAATLATGKSAWSTESDPELRGCSFNGLALAGALAYGVATCSGTFELYGLSARTGAVESKVRLHDQACADSPAGRPTLWATSGYLLVGCSDLEYPRNQLVVLHPGSSHQAVITYSSKSPPLEYPENPVQPVPFVLVGTTLYVEASGSNYKSAIDAVDLASGRQLWQREPPGYLVGADKSGVLTVIVNDGSDSSAPPSVSLAAMSTRSGAVSYGPGTTLKVSNPDNYGLTLIGHTLIAAAANPQDSPIIAYNTGSWPR